MDYFNNMPPEYYVEAIKAAHHDSIEAIIKIGTLLNQAKDNLPHAKFERAVINKLPFSWREANRYMKIACNRFLIDSTNWSNLPASKSALYELARVEDPEILYEEKKRKNIHPNMTADDAKQLSRNRIIRTRDCIKYLIELSTLYSPQEVSQHVDDQGYGPSHEELESLADFIQKISIWTKVKDRKFESDPSVCDNNPEAIRAERISWFSKRRSYTFDSLSEEELFSIAMDLHRSESI